MKIPSISLVPAPKTRDAQAAVGFKLAGEPIDCRHRFGGDPEWIQWPDVTVVLAANRCRLMPSWTFSVIVE